MGQKFMALLAFMLALGVLSGLNHCTAAEVEWQFGSGRCDYKVVLDGTFWQADLHTDNYMHPSCFELGWARKWKGSERFGWRVALYAANEIAARGNIAVNDEQWHNHGMPCQPTVTGETGCLIRFNGSGYTYGVTTTFTAEQRIAEHTSIIVEAGFFFFAHHFKAEGRFINCATCDRQISYNETSNLWDYPQTLAGVTLRYRDVYFAYRHYLPASHRPLSITTYAQDQFMVGVAW